MRGMSPRRPRRRRVRPLRLAALAFILAAGSASGQIAPITSCDAAGIGSATLSADGVSTSIVDVSTGVASGGQANVAYCLVKVRVPEAINIWVVLPMDGAWNGRLQSQGGG